MKLTKAAFLIAQVSSAAAKCAGVPASLLFVSAVSAAAFDAAEFASRKTIQLALSGGESLIAVPIDSETFDAVRPGIPDLRVIAQGAVEVPFMIEKAVETRTRSIEKISPSAVQTLRELPGNRIEIILRLEENAPNADLLRIHTPLTDFERRVNVFGSPDGEQWKQLVNDALVFDYSRFFDIQNLDVDLQDNDNRHFRVVIEGIIDEKASPFRTLWLRSIGDQDLEHAEGFSVRNRPFRIDRIELLEKRERETFKSERKWDYPIRSLAVNRDEKEKRTIIEIETGREPLTALSIATPDRNFSRRARVEVEKQVHGSADWVEIGSAILTAIDYLDYRENELSISFPEHRQANYRLTIEDEDNPPLRIESVAGEGNRYNILFIGKTEASYEVFYESDKAEAPKYDFATVIAPLRHTYQPIAATLGPEIPNPAYEPATDKPRLGLLDNKLFLTTTIAAMVLILAWALFSTSRKIESG